MVYGRTMPDRIIRDRVVDEIDAAHVRVVRCGTAELIVRHGRIRWTARAVDRPAFQILQIAATAEIANEHIQLVVGSNAEHAAIVIAPCGLARVLLNRPNPRFGNQARGIEVRFTRREVYNVLTGGAPPLGLLIYGNRFRRPEIVEVPGKADLVA